MTLLSVYLLSMVRAAFISFPITVVKYPDKCHLKEKGLVLPRSVRYSPIVAGKIREQELEAAGHVPIVPRQSSECLLVLSLLPGLYIVQDSLPKKWSHPQSRCNRNQDNPFPACPEAVSQVVLGSVQSKKSH